MRSISFRGVGAATLVLMIAAVGATSVHAESESNRQPASSEQAQMAEKAPPVHARRVKSVVARKAKKVLADKNERDDPHGPAAVHAHWAYDGADGPGKWAGLSPDYVTCAKGTRQSPIDIRDGIRVDLPPITFDYQPSNFRIIDNGHTIQAAVRGSRIVLIGKTYDLVQFHFHRPSEERINGRVYDMVVHLVHKSADDKVAVVAVPLTIGYENPLIQTLWNYLPLETNDEVAPADVLIDLTQLLPYSRSYYTYIGSLTTPPCSEGVTWLVLKEPVNVSAEQVSIFARLYRNNARPIQPSNGRLIKESN